MQRFIRASKPPFYDFHNQQNPPTRHQRSSLKPLSLANIFSVYDDSRTLQSILASARRVEGLKLFANRILGAGIFVFRPDNRFRATMTGTEDFVTT